MILDWEGQKKHRVKEISPSHWSDNAKISQRERRCHAEKIYYFMLWVVHFWLCFCLAATGVNDRQYKDEPLVKNEWAIICIRDWECGKGRETVIFGLKWESAKGWTCATENHPASLGVCREYDLLITCTC